MVYLLESRQIKKIYKISCGYGKISQNRRGKKKKVKKKVNRNLSNYCETTLKFADNLYKYLETENILGYDTNKRSIEGRQKFYIEGFQHVLNC